MQRPCDEKEKGREKGHGWEEMEKEGRGEGEEKERGTKKS